MGSVRLILAWLLVAAVASAQVSVALDRERLPENSSGGKTAQAIGPGEGGVVAQDGLGAAVGGAILGRGGNAVDAAVATAFALAVTHPAAGNIGGGGFLLLWRPGRGATSFDFREMAPAAAGPNMFLGPDGEYSADLHHESHRSVGVPGTVAGLWAAHARYGRLPWSDLVAPAVALARDGFRLTEWLAADFVNEKKRLLRRPATAAVYFKADGVPYAPGELFRQPDLARALERIAATGRDGFYRGPTADFLVAEMKRGGGLITHQDLAEYRAVERPCVSGSYRQATILSMGPPSSGGLTLLNMLNMLESFPVERDPVRRTHLFAETMRRGFADRARWLGDPDQNDPAPMLRLAAKDHGRERARSIDRERASKSVLENFSWSEDGDHTTHLSVVDRDLWAVALTYTLEDRYGSAIVAAGTGILLNNEMGDFNARPGLTNEKGLIGSPPNIAAPKKRMLSSMTPTIVLDSSGRPIAVLGSPGGRTIINTVFQLTANLVDLELPIDAAVAAGRCHHQWFPDELRIEERALTAPGFATALERLGHRIVPAKSIGAAECLAIRWDEKGAWTLVPGVDPRAKDGGFRGER